MLSNGVSDSLVTAKPPVPAIITRSYILMVPICNQLRNSIQCTLIRRFGKLANELAGLVGECLGPVLNAPKSVVLLDQRADQRERNALIAALPQNGLDQPALFRRRPLQRVNQRQCD